MSRGFFMQLKPVSRSDRELELLVFASGWDDGVSEPVEVGRLSVKGPERTATFSSSSPWVQDIVVEPFADCSLEPRESYGLWKRWLLELGAKAFVGTESLVRFI
ncbi:hypothetical protein [Methyloversatilis sp. RAC08]|uniref:hypothetical protein n=1 Tax=Methyloversatilis sp. RAC08 TaxID=1842540 RepID=UPI00123787B0|nr:hypothetical protein [Methyloversatilis sp. RAC08]